MQELPRYNPHHGAVRKLLQNQSNNEFSQVLPGTEPVVIVAISQQHACAQVRQNQNGR